MGLDVVQMTEVQDDKEVTSNDADARIEGALANLTTIAMADANVNLTTPAANVDLALSNLCFDMTGVLTADRTLSLPDASTAGKLYVVRNSTTGGFDVIVVRGAGGASVIVQPGNKEILYNDGVDIVSLGVDVLDDVFDVTVPSPTNGQHLSFVTSSSDWQALDVVEEINKFIEVPAVKTYVLVQSAAFPSLIDTVIHEMGAGSLDFVIQIDGVSVTGLDGPEGSTTTEATSTASALNAVPIGGRVTIDISNLSGPADFGFTVRSVRTG